MDTKNLIVVHGMGQHDDVSVKEKVLDSFTAAFGFYKSLNGRNPSDSFSVVPVSYNSFFDDYRAKLLKRSGSIADRLAEIDDPASFPLRAVETINAIEMTLGKDEFFFTHWLDVVLYYITLLSEPIRLRVAEAIANSIAEVGAANVHVMGHSLGTAVVHDTLAKAYGPANLVAGAKKVLNLSPVEQRLGGVHMVANVSRALQTFVKAGLSIVRPGPMGCTSVFVEYRHKLDPITRIRPFDPTDNDGWVSHDIYRSAYSLIELTSVTEANVHDLGHYLVNPKVHLPMFRLLFGFRPVKKEREEAESIYFESTIEGKAKALQAAFGELQPKSPDSLHALLLAAKDLKDMVQSFGEQF